MRFAKQSTLIVCVLIFSSLVFSKMNLASNEFSDIKIFRVIYAHEFINSNGKMSLVIDGAVQEGDDLPVAGLFKSAIAFIGETQVGEQVSDNLSKDFVVARDAYFQVTRENQVKADPLYLLNAGWKPCLVPSLSQAIATSDAGLKAVKAWDIFILKGCATAPNQYASLAIEGSNITNIYWVNEQNKEKEFYEVLERRYSRPHDYYKGMSSQIVALDKSLQAKYKRDDEKAFKREQEKQNKDVENKIAEYNRLIKKAKVKFEKIHAAQDGLFLDDVRLQPFIKAALGTDELQNAKPLIFIKSGSRHLVVFQDDERFTLTEIVNTTLQVLQTVKLR
ncbi:MAG TPA: hypothetical protein DHW71_03705 [Gammaproteobacteria bacterium]|nr:hypothetical protein [Gammaproteobacteria bacterium]HBF09057.1 hypothetical protein [Gammaproteobacteria bacterium]HCK92064.1 hypothetical protein [Gammaproteobacteria bacterium]